MAAPGSEWKVGAVVMMDALGVKGIWKYHGRQEVLDRLHLIERSVRQLIDIPSAKVARGMGFDPFITFLSDTIVMAFSDPRRPSAVVDLAIAAAGYALHAGATDNQEGRTWSVPLAYRGAIAFGEFHAEERYVLGPAIDEAAGAMDRPEGAFVYLTPSARDLFAYQGQRPVAARWRVPLKGAGRRDPLEEYDTWLASPFAHDAGGASTTWDVADLLLKTFDRGQHGSISPSRSRRAPGGYVAAVRQRRLAEWTPYAPGLQASTHRPQPRNLRGVDAAVLPHERPAAVARVGALPVVRTATSVDR